MGLADVLAQGTKKSPTSKYKTMSLEEIAALPVGALCKGPTLVLCWGTVPLMRKQIQIVEHWGFEYKTALMWHKVFRLGRPPWAPAIVCAR